MINRKFRYFYMIKFFLIIFSFILLSVILYRLIESYREPVFGDEDGTTLGIIIISLAMATIFFLSIMEVFSIKEYRGYFIRRSYFKKGRSHLSLSDIFENENRINLLTEILNNPGVHHNELLRNCNLQKGQLQWHVDVLLKNHIIKREKSGQYTTYFPITSSIEKHESSRTLLNKSKTTSEIFDIIKKNPGIYPSEISRILNLSRNTIKYHIDKLSEEKLVKLSKKGRKIELYPILH